MAQSKSTGLIEREPSSSMLIASDAWWSTVAECQREMLEFISNRFEKDGEALREAMTCRSLGDALAVQSRWIDETLKDYSTEAGRLLSIYSKAAENAAPGTMRR